MEQDHSPPTYLISDNHMHNFTCAYKMPINFRTVTYANTISFSLRTYSTLIKQNILGLVIALNKGNSRLSI